MRVKQIPRSAVREVARLHIRQRSRGAAVFRVTGAASDGLALHHLAMRGGGIVQLDSNIRMTDLAAVAKRRGFPGGGVAFGAIAADFGV